MGARSQDRYAPGTLVRDRDGDVWRKGTAWWHWTRRSANTGPGKLLEHDLIRRYGPVTVVHDPKSAVHTTHPARDDVDTQSTDQESER